MSYDFCSTRIVKGRKTHCCDQCGKAIQPGEEHSYSAGKYDGDFFTVHEHVDCRNLWLKLWDIRGSSYGDTQDVLRNDDELSEDWIWIKEEYPAVAARLPQKAPHA